MNRFIWVLLLSCCAGIAATGQDCPKSDPDGSGTPSGVQTLNGRLMYHDGLRKWFELKLDQPHCGQQAIQLTTSDEKWNTLQILRGCAVRSSGRIYFSPTGYYSLDLSQGVIDIEAFGACEKKQPIPDLSNLKPARNARNYRVDMALDYEAGDHPPVVRISSGGKELKPWQAYASYYLTGGFVLYGHCGEGFVVDRVFGTTEAKPSHFTESRSADDMAAFDPESAAAAGKKNLRLGYTCVRSR